MEEKECPKCKGIMNRMGKFTNMVELTVDKNNCPQYFEDEVEDYRALYLPDEVFWECESCEYREVIDYGTKND